MEGREGREGMEGMEGREGRDRMEGREGKGGKGGNGKKGGQRGRRGGGGSCLWGWARGRRIDCPSHSARRRGPARAESEPARSGPGHSEAETGSRTMILPGRLRSAAPRCAQRRRGVWGGVGRRKEQEEPQRTGGKRDGGRVRVEIE